MYLRQLQKLRISKSQMRRLDEELAKMAESYNMEVEKLKEFMGENEKKQMKEDLAVQEAVTFLVENAVEK